MQVYTQDAGETRTWLHDWSVCLARAELDLGLTPGSLTLTGTPTVVGPQGTTIASVARNGTSTGVLFKLSTNLVPQATVTLTTTVTLSNGDTDVDYLTIGIN